jgi:hypothetical protein
MHRECLPCTVLLVAAWPMLSIIVTNGNVPTLHVLSSKGDESHSLLHLFQ